MRTIKFRAWNKINNKMVDLQKITPLALSDSMNTQLSIQGISGIFIPFSSEFVIEQFTGLQDKNGKDIYEGDIVKTKEYEYLFRIYWRIECCQFCLISNNGHIELPKFSNVNQNNFEIAGNIHENPELI